MSYETSPATALVATSCAICSRPLVDVESLVRGVGPVCAEKYGFFVDVPAEAREEGNRLIYLVAVRQAGPEVVRALARLRELGFDQIVDSISDRLGGVPTLDLRDGRLMLSFPYSAETVQGVKAACDKVGGRRRFDPNTKSWELDVASARATNVYFDGTLIVTAEASAALVAKVEVPVKAPFSEGRVTVRDGQIVVETPYNAGAVAALKAAAQGHARWDAGNRAWSVPLARAAVVGEALKAFFPVLGAEVAALAPAPKGNERALAALTKASKVEEAGAAAQDVVQAVRERLRAVLPAGKVLYPYQEAGVAFLEAAGGRALVADEMGLGKTVQALMWLAIHPEVQKVVIVVPASLCLNWAREAAAWAPALKTTVIGSTKAALPAAGVVILSYELATRKAAEIEAWGADAVVLDEAHYLKEAKTKRTKAILGENVTT